MLDACASILQQFLQPLDDATAQSIRVIGRVDMALAVPHAVTVATLHPPRDVNVGMPPEQTLTLPQTWNAAIDVHVYRLPGAQKDAGV